MTKQVDPDKVCWLLDKLGNTPDEIAQFLTDRNMTGCHFTNNCPIFHYLDMNLPEAQGDIWVDALQIRVGGLCIVCSSRYFSIDTTQDDVRIGLPDNAVLRSVPFEFISRYDKGDYAQLDSRRKHATGEAQPQSATEPH